jgi:bacterioferritin
MIHLMTTHRNSNSGGYSKSEPMSRNELVELLNQDLAREYQAIIAYTVYSQIIKGAEYTNIAEELAQHASEELDHALKLAKQIDYLGGIPTTVSKNVKISTEARELLQFDLDNERETIAHYTHRIRQAEELGEFALSEVLRSIIVQEQEHEMDLCDALGIDVPQPIEVNE